MTLIPSIRDNLERDNALRNARQRVSVLDYTQKVDAMFDFDILDISTKANNIMNEQNENVLAGVDVQLHRGIDNIMNWVRKALQVEPEVYPIYSDRYGFGLIDIFGKGISNDAIHALLPLYLTETLTYHPNIIDVTNVRSRIDGENLFANFIIVLDSQDTYSFDNVWVVS